MESLWVYFIITSKNNLYVWTNNVGNLEQWWTRRYFIILTGKEWIVSRLDPFLIQQYAKVDFLILSFLGVCNISSKTCWGMWFFCVQTYSATYSSYSIFAGSSWNTWLGCKSLWNNIFWSSTPLIIKRMHFSLSISEKSLISWSTPLCFPLSLFSLPLLYFCLSIHVFSSALSQQKLSSLQWRVIKWSCTFTGVARLKGREGRRWGKRRKGRCREDVMAF